MISAEDIDAFRDQNAEALAACESFLRRCRKGIPPDRWATTQGMALVARGIAAYQQIIAWQTDALIAVTEAIAREPDADR